VETEGAVSFENAEQMPMGARVRRFRELCGMTQEELAHAIAVTVSTVNRWENLHADPSRLALKALRELGDAKGVAL
jgi:putative transcriptional regulator